MTDQNLPASFGGDTPDSVSRMSALDLYEDLLIGEDKYDENRVYTMQEILEEKGLLEEQNASLLNQIVALKVEMKKMEAEKLALQRNFDSLLATARVELNRKNMLLWHLDGRPKTTLESTSRSARPKSTSAPKKKNLGQLYKGKRVPEDELGTPRQGPPISDYKSSSQQIPAKSARKNAAVSSSSGPDQIPTHREASPKEFCQAPSHTYSERRTTKYNRRENEHRSAKSISPDEYKSSSRRIVPTNRVKDSTVPISSMPRKTSAPRDTIPRKNVVDDSPVPLMSISRDYSRGRDPYSRDRRQTRFSNLNNHLMIEKMSVPTNFSIPPMEHERIEADYRSSKSNVARNDPTDDDIRTTQSREAVKSLHGKNFYKQRKISNHRTETKSGMKTDWRESRSYQLNTPSKSSPFSLSCESITSHTSGSLMQKVRSPRQDQPLLEEKVTSQGDKSTLTNSDSKKLSANPEQSSNKPKSQKSRRRIILTRVEKNEHQPRVSESNPLLNAPLHKTYQTSSVTLKQQYPLDGSELPVNSPASPEGSKGPSATAASPISPRIRIRETEDKGCSSRSGGTRALSVDSLETNSYNEERNEPHGSNNLIHATVVENDRQSTHSPSEENPVDVSKLPTDKPAHDPFDNIDEIQSNADGTSIPLINAATGDTLNSAIPSEYVSNSNERDSQVRTIHSPAPSLPLSPMSASIKDGLKVVIKTNRSAGEKPVLYSAAELSADLQPHVRLVDIKSIDSSLDNDDKQKLETPAVCRKRKHSRSQVTNSKRQKSSDLRVTDEPGTKSVALLCDSQASDLEQVLTTNVKPTAESATSKAKDIAKFSGAVNANVHNVSCDTKTKRTPPCTSSRPVGKDSIDGDVVALENLEKAPDDRSKAILTESHKEHGRARLISTSSSSPELLTAPSSLNAWLASGQVKRQNIAGKPSPVVVPPECTRRDDTNLIQPVSDEIQCNSSCESKNFHNAELRWLLRLAVEELKALKAKETRTLWLSSLNKCQERRKENAKWSS